jgi:hypothetical protein
MRFGACFSTRQKHLRRTWKRTMNPQTIMGEGGVLA